MSNITYDEVLRLWESLPVLPEVKTSEFIEQGQAYQATTSDHYGRPRTFVIVHPNDLQTLLAQGQNHE